MNIFRPTIWSLLLTLLFGDSANAFSVKPGARLYAGASYSAFVAGKISGEDIRTEKRKFLTVTKDRLMDSTLESFGGKIGFIVSGISIETECLYGRTTSSSLGPQTSDPTKTETTPTSDENFSTERVYLLGILNTNLEFSGVTLLSPYVGVGIGSGSILTEGNDGNYGFPLVTQLRMGLKSDLELFSVAIKPYFGYRLMLISSLCAKKLTDVPAIVTDHLDPNLGIVETVKGSVSKIREMSHVSHNIEAGIVFHTR
ncbi:cell surface protein [Neorickettsia findlayensis]|uniref:Cell surface protein n=1 Tax=Neorickettsia findlayensis TaxID=2686014 RepID=A0A6P1GAF0_9RICK|nr:cell surface protein [Neorickettsia findlayensis]QHD65469.1 cell surface protein [Neorickettsia findlayensis]